MNAYSVYRKSGRYKSYVNAAVAALGVDSRGYFQRALPDLAVYGMQLKDALNGQAFGSLVHVGALRIATLYGEEVAQ